MTAKSNLKFAKSVKKYGTANMFGTRDIYGQKPTSNEITAINIKENNIERIRNIGSKATKTILATVGPVAATTAGTELYFKKKYGRFMKPSLSFNGGHIYINYT